MQSVNWLKSAQNSSENINRFLKTKFEEDVLKFKRGEIKEDGGWGDRKGQSSNVGATAFVIRALIKAGENSQQDYIKDGCNYLESAQKLEDHISIYGISEIGSWGATKVSPSVVAETSSAISALYMVYGKERESVQLGRDWLMSVQNTKTRLESLKKADLIDQYMNILRLSGEDIEEELPKADGGWGSSHLKKSSVFNASSALLALSEITGSTKELQEAIEYLENAQDSNGGWEDASFTSALAIRSLLQCGVSAKSKWIKNGIKYLNRVQSKGGYFGRDESKVFHTPQSIMAILKYYKKM